MNHTLWMELLGLAIAKLCSTHGIQTCSKFVGALFDFKWLAQVGAFGKLAIEAKLS